MGDNISYNLAKNGFNVAKILPFGPVENLMPYLIRRAQENSSLEGQSNRELVLINRELFRRN
jgi:proline dehydrogenase